MDAQKDNLNIASLSLFKSDNYLVFIYKKTQSLINAIYMVTNLFPEAEPLKWGIRAKAVTLLEDILSLPIKAFSERKNILRGFTAKVLEIVSLSEVSSNSALMSSMNFKILNREFENLINMIEKHEEPYLMDSNFILDEKLFKISNDPRLSDNLNKRTNLDTKGQSLELARDKGQGHLKDMSQVKSRDNRQEAILSLLRDKSDLNIKDISSVFKDCSEKTLQRELQRMVVEGRLKKAGERRWSRYSLI